MMIADMRDNQDLASGLSTDEGNATGRERGCENVRDDEVR